MNEERIPRDIITVGASAGGVEGLLRLIPQLPADLPVALVAVIHRSPLFVSHLADLLGKHARLPVQDAIDGAPVERGRVYLAPPDLHLLIEGAHFRLRRTPKVNFTRPAVDPLFQSAAATYGPRVVGVLLSGGGRDGAGGLMAIKAAGGLSIVQDPAEAPHSSMPANAIVHGHIDAILPLECIASVLLYLAAGHAVDPTPEAKMR